MPGGSNISVFCSKETLMWFEKRMKLKEGEIRFMAQNGFADLFLNACKSKGAVLKDIDFTDGVLKASISGKDYAKILAAAKMTGMDIQIIYSRGILFLLHRYRKRIGIPVGIALGILVYLILSSMIWSIDITGLQTLREHELREYLAGMDVKNGMFIAAADCREIERRAEMFDPAVLRATANLVGCKLFIHIKERARPPELKDEKRYCNIVAAKDGEVLKTDIFAGVSQVKAGDTVHAGDLLVSGAKLLRTGETRLMIASACVIARTTTGVSCNTPLEISVKSLSGRRDRYSLCVFGLEFPSNTANGPSIAQFLHTQDSIIPIGFKRTRETKYEDTRLKLRFGEASLLAFTDLAQTVSGALEKTDILSCTADVSENNGAQIDCVLTCEEDIAKEELFQLISEQKQ